MKWFKSKPEETKPSSFEVLKQGYLVHYDNCTDEARFKIMITFSNKRQLSYINDKYHVAWLLACFSNKTQTGFSYSDDHDSDVVIDFSKVTDIIIKKVENKEEEIDDQ